MEVLKKDTNQGDINLFQNATVDNYFKYCILHELENKKFDLQKGNFQKFIKIFLSTETKSQTQKSPLRSLRKKLIVLQMMKLSPKI